MIDRKAPKKRPCDRRTFHPLYRSWAGMMARCYNPEATGYYLYGGRGIAVHQRWRESFWDFATDIIHEIGDKPSQSHTLDRIKCNGHYEPGNLRWATRQEQSNNRRMEVVSQYAGKAPRREKKPTLRSA